ncbi:MAG: DUF3955 domain-containing protein [Verrucomicrobia bacterium]|nr:DUF3955 domain-containing protein [Verrucomicrobiota bacterium]
MSLRHLVAAIACLLAAKGCYELFHRLGSHVDDQGFLHEPFGLIPLGWLFVLAGAVLIVLSWVRRNK